MTKTSVRFRCLICGVELNEDDSVERWEEICAEKHTRGEIKTHFFQKISD